MRRLRLPATSLYDLVHRRPGQKCAGGAFYAKGMQHEGVPQLCRPQTNGPAGRPSYGLLKEVGGTGNLSVETTGNGCPAVRSDPIRHVRYVRRDRPGRTNHRQSRFANPTTTCLEARSVLRNRKLKIKHLDALHFWIFKHNVNGKVVTPTSRN